jgi:LmbE family N-acetylglucosaminyl deacetylase
MLVLAPHVDDEVLVLGSIMRVENPFIYALSPCYESAPNPVDRGQMAREFGVLMNRCGWDHILAQLPVRNFPAHRQEILERFVTHNKRLRPKIVLCPSSTDRHQDHRVVYEEACRAFKNTAIVLGWESPHNSKESTTNVFVEIERQALEQKIAAWGHYESQQFRTQVTPEYIRSLATVRGKQRNSSTGYAEAFELINLRI